MLTTSARRFFGLIIHFLFISTSSVHSSVNCDLSLSDRSYLLIRFIRYTARNGPEEVATLVWKALEVKPLANPFEEGTTESGIFERFFSDLVDPDIAPNAAKAFRHNLIVSLTHDECFYLSALTQNQEIPSARKP